MPLGALIDAEGPDPTVIVIVFDVDVTGLAQVSLLVTKQVKVFPLVMPEAV